MSFRKLLWIPLTTIFLFGNINCVLATGLDKQEACDILCGGPAILRPGPSYRFGIGGDPNELGIQGWNYINQIARGRALRRRGGLSGRGCTDGKGNCGDGK